MATLRPPAERLRDQRRRELIGWIVIIAGGLVGTGLFTALVAHYGW
jgi:hypothetical protein